MEDNVLLKDYIKNIRSKNYIKNIKIKNEVFRKMNDFDGTYLISNYGRIIRDLFISKNNRIIRPYLLHINYSVCGYYFIVNKTNQYIDKYFKKYFHKNISKSIIERYNQEISIRHKKYSSNRFRSPNAKYCINVIQNDKVIDVLSLTEIAKKYHINPKVITETLNKNIEYKGYKFKDIFYINKD